MKRIHDQLVEKKLSDAVSSHNFNEERSFQLMQVEDIYNETNMEGLSSIVNRLFNSFRELASQPDNDTIRSVVRENASIVVADIQRVRSSLNDLKGSIERKISGSVDDINSILHNIGKLNVEITNLENSHGETGDLRDERDKAIKTLSEYFDVHTYEDGNGNYNVNAVGVGTLVTAGAVEELATADLSPPEGTPIQEYEGRLGITFKRNPSVPVNTFLKKGKIGALLQTRDGEIKKMQDSIDTFAYELANTVNAIHRRGYANRKVETDSQGRAIAGSANGPVTGINFFEIPVSRHRAAEKLNLSLEIKEDVRNIATGLSPNSPGDNRVALAIAKVQHEKILNDGTTTMEEFYLKSVGDIGLAAGKATIDMEHSEGIMAQATSLRERISGVSIDEETANMVRYQHAYDASAKVMKAANDMFNSVLKILD